ncbi:hypothetical protein RvY_09733 [Ramazzottius varieornatus]|uniref:rRNA methyltransferase 1, mitochondrial n=1 Tax=Ramazzottius varieornatus TaxID=947166 RepID=A0A1D1VAE7_RAMVA|nr:hypothetical protein RvY_09733 [Ramazzottius varieornatus]
MHACFRSTRRSFHTSARGSQATQTVGRSPNYSSARILNPSLGAKINISPTAFAVSPVLLRIVDLLRTSTFSAASRTFATAVYSEDLALRKDGSKDKRKQWVTGDLFETVHHSQPPEVAKLNVPTRGPNLSRSVTEKTIDEKDDIFDPSDVHRPKQPWPYNLQAQFTDAGRKRRSAGPKDDLRGGDVVFGTNPVLLALRQQRRNIYGLFITEAKSLSQEPEIKDILRICKERSIPVVQMQSAQLMRLSENRPHQGLCLDCTPYLPEEIDPSTLKEQKPNRRNQLWLFLDSVMDPMNLGAILRSGYFFGVDKFVLFNSCPPTSTVSKASAGVMEIAEMSTIRPKSIRSFFSVLKDQHWSITATCSKNELVQFSTAAKKGLESLEVRENTVLVIGNEHSGVNSDIIPFCDQVISVEPGNDQALDQANCLNVSVATGVILSQMAIKRKQQLQLNLKELT